MKSNYKLRENVECQFIIYLIYYNYTAYNALPHKEQCIVIHSISDVLNCYSL